MAEETVLPEPSELDVLKQRANLLGIKYNANIGVEALKEKIAKVQEGDKEEEKAPDHEDINAIRQRVQADALRLVRCRISCLNPIKNELHGEIFTVANNLIGTVSKYVPYDEAGESYHIPHCIYEHIKNRKYLSIRDSTKPGSHQVVISQKWVPEFSIEVLPPLSKKELKELAAAQLAAGNIDTSSTDLE